jgi:hypothetical protein
MAFHVLLRWDGVRRGLLDGLLDGRLLDPDQCTYSRGLRHGTSVHVTQTWRTLEAHRRFLRDVMAPAMAEAGTTQDPQIVVFWVSDLFLPRPAARVPSPRAARIEVQDGAAQ